MTQAPYPFLKWLTDKSVALALIALFSPVFVIAILSMALDMRLHPSSKGPWLYRERRITRGRQFDILKFRVLRADVLAQMEQTGLFARRYERDVNNLTWAGRYVLKKWYLDELPQLFNVLKGDMSLVGPRPWPLAKFEEQVARGVTYRKTIRAGWTGPAQLQKGKPNPQNAAKLDQEYIERCRTWSGWRLWRYDLKVLYETIKVTMEGKGLSY